MNNYYIRQLSNDQYYLLGMDYNSILNYIHELEDESLIQLNSGELIIDQLLVAGNGKNRFISCIFSHGKIDLSTAKNIYGTKEYKTLSSHILKEHYKELQYSILTNSQLNLIREGQVV
jgi:hypothetical protein